MKYAKPHLPYDQQLALLSSRGLTIDDPSRAIQDLKRIGYYRLSGYLYPFREVQSGGTATPRRPTRRDSFAAGARFDDGVALHDFDHLFRGVLFSGLQQVEIGLRVKVGYTLGKRGALAHLSPDALGKKASAHHPRRQASRYDVWRSEYDRHQEAALKGKQEFVLHFEKHYGAEVPVWAAVEFMPLGCLVSLLDLLDPRDQRTIARELAVKDPKVLLGWLRALNVLRNHCAHGNRVWNRPSVFQPDKLNLEMLTAPALLEHLATTGRAPIDHRVYFHASTTAYLLRSIAPETQWPTELVRVMAQFPEELEKFGLSPARSMGFTARWSGEHIWQA